jgi:hypothetical protein
MLSDLFEIISDHIMINISNLHMCGLFHFLGQYADPDA